MGGFSVGDSDLWDFLGALVLALLLLDLVFDVVRGSSSSHPWPLCALGLHAAAALVLCTLSATDLALFVGADGARVSLPLVLFALAERQYVVNVVQPWLHVLLASVAVLVAAAAVLGPPLVHLVRRVAPAHAVPWPWKLCLLAACVARLWARGLIAKGVGADLLTQLGADAVALFQGTLFSASLADVLTVHRVEVEEPQAPRPPLLLFHWEAGGEQLLGAPRGNFSAATPFLRELVARGEAVAFPGFVTVPMTLKSAWEVLCGMPPALTSDFREQGSALRRECLPRLLARCCGYHSILAKTDTQLPDMPQRVFGFKEVIIAPSDEELLAVLKARLRSLGALDGQVPVLLYFYAGEAHAPYSPGRVPAAERGRFSESGAEDVFLALHHRTDAIARRLAAFWPPPLEAPAAGRWRPEHGLAVYFGDHGELLDSEDPAPHGNSLAPEVARVLLAVEGRAFMAQRGARGPQGTGVGGAAASGPPRRGLCRLADVFSTVAECLGLRARGQLQVGQSLLGQQGHQVLASFSFYRPAELAAIHRAPKPGEAAYADGQVRSVQFVRTRAGWVASGTPAIVGSNDTAAEELEAVLATCEETNDLLTRSNVHAAWLVARLRAAAEHAKAAVRAAVAKILPALAAPNGV